MPPPRRPRRRPVRSARRRRPGPRRLLAALLAAVAVAATGYVAADPRGDDGLPVLVATGRVAVGTVLSADDVEERRVPADVVPDGALERPGAAVGLPAAAVLSPGEVLTTDDVRTGSLLVGRGTDQLAVWLPLPEPQVAAALSAGDLVDVLSPVDGRLVVSSVPVLAVPVGAGGGRATGLVGAAGGGTATATGAGAWVAVSADEASSLAAARGADPAGGGLLVALRGPTRGR